MGVIITGDVPAPPPDAELGARAVGVALVPQLAGPELLLGAVVLVIDALRASTTIVHALESGAACVVPTLTVREALVARAGLELRGLVVRTGGERGGVRPEGFDAGNSPGDYGPGGAAQIVAGCALVFTSTNGTGTLLHAARGGRAQGAGGAGGGGAGAGAMGAGAVLVASLRNRAAVCAAVVHDERPVVVLCAGTREAVSMEDALVAGAIVERLREGGRTLLPDDSSRMCAALWREASARVGGVLEVFRASRGGRNLRRLGLDADIAFCAEVDVSAIVPRLEAGDAQGDGGGDGGGWRIVTG